MYKTFINRVCVCVLNLPEREAKEPNRERGGIGQRGTRGVVENTSQNI